MKVRLLLVFVLSGVTVLFGQKKDWAAHYATLIDSVDLRTHLEVLASNAYEGRETGKKGQQMAAAYLIEKFKKIGVAQAPGSTGYEQYFKVVETKPGGSITWSNTTLTFKSDFIYYGAKSKWSVNDLPLMTLETAKLLKPVAYVLVAKIETFELRSEVQRLKVAAPSGLKGIVLLHPNYDQVYEYLEHYTTSPSMRLLDNEQREEIPTIMVNTKSIEASLAKPFRYLIGKGKQSKKASKKAIGVLSGTLNEGETILTSSNVLAFIPGSDPILSKEIIVITAHYDHIGIDNGTVYNGADDDGTGTVALLELAEAFMQAYQEGHGVRRSILIMPVSGEEKGLLGSAYYTDHPLIPLEQTVANLNIDMIGRNDIAHENKTNYIYVIGADRLSDDLHNANEWANTNYTKLELDYRFNDPKDPNQFYYRSDHYNFAKNNIPSVFYFSGVHEDYHQPTDDIEKIIFSKVELVTRLVFHTAWKLANETERPRLKL